MAISSIVEDFNRNLEGIESDTASSTPPPCDSLSLR